jgi:hypothetical protein
MSDGNTDGDLDIPAEEERVFDLTNQYLPNVIGVNASIESPELRRTGQREPGRVIFEQLSPSEQRQALNFALPPGLLTEQSLAALYSWLNRHKVGEKHAIDNLSRMTERQQLGLAYDMFVNVPGAYQSFDSITNDDGTLNPENFMAAWEKTFQYAVKAGPENMNFTTKYFDILMTDAGSERELSDPEFDALMRDAEAEAGSLVDPANTNYLLTSRLAPMLGRRPTVLDQRRFFEFMQEQRAARPAAADVALADEFIQEADPGLSQEYGDNLKQRAARGVLGVIGVGGGR